MTSTPSPFPTCTTLDRRAFLRNSLLSAAGLSGPATWSSFAQTAGSDGPPRGSAPRVALIDTHVHLFEWPFRHLKYANTPALVAKLRKHGVKQAWAGSFEGLLSKDLTGVNGRLVEECRRNGDGMLVPIGSVNPAWPDWEEELRRCHEVHRMTAIRLHPTYQNFTLDDERFARLMQLATDRRLLVQIALEQEDPRVHHPIVHALNVSAAPLATLLPRIPGARVQLIHDSFSWMRMPQAKPLLTMSAVMHDISSLESVGAVGRIIEGKHWSLTGRIPVERLLFGSHAPYFPVENALLKLFESPLTLEQMTAIMEGNAKRVMAVT